jgi:hypothetical protein
MKDIKAGYISDVRLRVRRDKKLEWRFVVRKDSGGIGPAEVKVFEAYCLMLQIVAKDRGHFVDVTFKVVDSEGRYVEEWYAFKGMVLRKKIGKVWWKSRITAQ